MAERENSVFGTGVNRSTATERKSITDHYNQESIGPSSVLIGKLAGRTGAIKSVKDRSLATDLDGKPKPISQEKTIGNDVPLSAATDRTIN